MSTLCPIPITTIFLLMIVFVAVDSFAQSRYNHPGEITEQEFNELRKDRFNFVPSDLGDTVVIVKYTSASLFRLMKKARNISFAQNGADTTGISDEAWMSEDQLKKFRDGSGNATSKHPRDLQKALKKKGIFSIIVDENKLTSNQANLRKYWLKTAFVSSQKSLEDVGWVSTVTNVFYDPSTGKEFEIFLPSNYGLLALIK